MEEERQENDQGESSHCGLAEEEAECDKAPRSNMNDQVCNPYADALIF
jgi:hypothetical protein